MIEQENRKAGEQENGKRSDSRFLLSCSLALLLSCALNMTTGTCLAAEPGPGDLDHVMYADPVLVAPPTNVRFHPRLKELMAAALERPDVDTRRRAADNIGRLSKEGMPGLGDLVGPLTKLLNGSPLHPRLRLAAARALVRLDGRSAAPALRKHAGRDGLDMILLVDPALVAWNDESARQIWIDRIKDPTVSRAVHLSAIRSLEAVRHQPAVKPLRDMALDQALDPSLRLTAARALGRIVPRGLEVTAEDLLDRSRGVADRVVATAIVAEHKGDVAVALLRRMATDREPAVAFAALRRLVDLDPMHVRDLVDPLRVPANLMDHRGGKLSNLRSLADDPKIRLLAAEVLVFERKPEAVNLLAPMMDDPHPDVRLYVRRSLVEMDSQRKLQAAIRHVGVAALNADEVDHWRGVEQAALLMGAVDHEPVAQRLLDLLVAARAEVRIAAAVGLRRLAVEDTLPPVYATAQEICKALEGVFAFRPETSLEENIQNNPSLRDTVKHVVQIDLDQQVSHMMQMFSQMGYKEAEPLMRRHIPKHAYGHIARAGAVYALGHFYAGSKNSELAELLADRLSDTTPMNPEFPKVRRFSAIAIGRMKAADFSDTLEQFYEAENHDADIGGACRWALMHIDGKQRPPLEPTDRYPGGFFIEPADDLVRGDHLIAQP